ncbi:hypothetical protein BDFB_010335 [Asbolus verrucosus]|uniref:Uncharacterized protein n=1 Tax=Asbolus verrucosus TaxID=1661398 RepID=A0A482VLR1_ASBVE|nr:hypothetical protein BDFB_010335 [Asbolus verrucosus]
MENALILSKLALKNFGNIFQLSLILLLSSVEVLIKKSTGRPKKRTPEVVEEVRGLMEVTLSKSIKKLSQQIHLACGTSQTIFKKDFEMFPYNIQICHKILPRNFVPRVNYCEWFLYNINDDILNVTFFADEVWFFSEGYVNLVDENPREYIETPFHPLKIGLWVAI